MKRPFIAAIAWAATAFVSTLILISLVGTIALVTSGNASDVVDKNIQLFGLNLVKIHSDRQGFEVTNQVGSLLLPTLCAILTFITTILSRKYGIE